MNVKKISLKKTDSTNSFAKKNHLTFDLESLTVITAEEQTAGYGQFQRPWISPKGVNLYCTLFFSLPLRCRESISALTLEMATILQAVLRNNGFLPTLKWPNDLLLNGKKVAGVLCELEFGERIHVILGFGLNVNMEGGALEKIDQPATSLKKESGRDWDREVLLNEVLDLFLKIPLLATQGL